jgi:L-lactate dehydrogenase (cytochrome)
MIPTLASCSFDEIVDAAVPGQTQWMQLYVNKDRDITEKIVRCAHSLPPSSPVHPLTRSYALCRKAEARGIKGLFITVDAPQLGRREKDMRQKFSDDGSNVQQNSTVDKSQGAARAISSFISTSLCWADIPWFMSITKMPIVLKGVQCWEVSLISFLTRNHTLTSLL